jgi:hypothetical protein
MRKSFYCLLSTAALLLAGELGLRGVRQDGTLPYGYEKDGYLALVPNLETYGAGAISVVGSSRAREDILCPTLEHALGKRGVHEQVRNYALSGARADATNETIRHLLRASPRPELIVYGVSPMQLETMPTDPASHVSFTWELGDAWDALWRGAPDVAEYLPNATKNQLSDASLLFRLRQTMRVALTEPPTDPDWPDFDLVWNPPHDEQNPMLGQLPEKQQGKNRNQVLRVGARRIRKYLKGLYQEPEYPYTRQVPWLKDSLQLCQEAGVNLVLVEVPAAPALRQYSPARTYPGFYRLMTEVAKEFDVPFIRVKDVDVAFDWRDFREQSHMTYRGARKFTRALARFIPPR